MLPITQKILTNQNRPKKKLSKLLGLIIHWTANENNKANALANRNYFNNTSTYASAHFIVDDNSIIQCIPLEEIAYHVGANSYTSLKQSLCGNNNPNGYFVGIEICVNKDGDFSKSYQNAVELTKYLLDKLNLSVDQVYRHYDITGKICPAFFVNDITAKKYGFTNAKDGWEEFKNKVRGVDDVNIEKTVILDKTSGKKLGGIIIDGVSYMQVNEMRKLGKTVNWNAKEKIVEIEL